ncbi:MAG: sigma-54 dependent transcriptional regulator [Candidatus Hinthialibacter antarcticus]|nr:sigma-54 dependent transcriptional regulator [Candidatus Hinthialibacter antarcticus]
MNNSEEQDATIQDAPQKRKARILVVDDDETMAKTLTRALRSQGHDCESALTPEQGLSMVHENRYDLVLTDLVMPGIDGISLVRSIKSYDPNIPIILMTGFASVDNAVEAMKAGAFHYLTKPVRLHELQIFVEKALASHEMVLEVQELKDKLKGLEPQNIIVGKSQAMRNVITQIEQIAPSTATVLITGETGTGKEMIANAIHALSNRADKPMVKVNCGALPETLLESELFGHNKGSFTGAYKDQVGRFEMADGGTIFLDEIGEMSPSAQVKLLRVLQESIFERVGSGKSIQIDVRVIAATNRELMDEVKNTKFREDLYYRINVFNLKLPPLRERIGDIPRLAQHFIEKYARKNSKDVIGLGVNAHKALGAYSWPGNVRELENVIEHGVILAKGDRVLIDDLPELIRNASAPEEESTTSAGRITIPLGYSVVQSEGVVIRKTIEMTKGDKEAAAVILGYSTRTLYRKMKEHQIPLDSGADD